MRSRAKAQSRKGGLLGVFAPSREPIRHERDTARPSLDYQLRATSLGLVVGLTAACATTPAAPPPEPDWIARGSGVFGDQREFLVGVASSTTSAAPSLAQKTAHDRARAALNAEVIRYEASLSGLPAAALDVWRPLITTLRDRVTVEQWQRPDQVFFARARLSLKGALMAAASSRATDAGIKRALIRAVAATLVEPQWVSQGSTAQGGVGKVDVFSVKSWSLATSTADNRARAALADANGTQRLTSVAISDRWLGADGVLHALAQPRQ